MTIPLRTQHVSPQNCPALVLNADFRPLSYYPLSLWGWQDAIKAVFLDRVNIVSHYDSVVESPSFEMRLPSVVSLKAYVRPSRQPAFTRFNVFLRDRFTCQYCGEHEELTFDHVVPRSKGGATTWENVVAACSPCNLRKADRLPVGSAYDADAEALRAVDRGSAPQRPAVPAQLSARKLDGLSLLGLGARALMERLLRRILAMGFGFVLAASCGALFLPIAALSDQTVREAGFEAAIRGLFAMLDETARDGDPAAGSRLWARLLGDPHRGLRRAARLAALVGEIAGARGWSWYVGASGFFAAASPLDRARRAGAGERCVRRARWRCGCWAFSSSPAR